MFTSVLKYILLAAIIGSALSLTINAYYAAPIIVWSSLAFASLISIVLKRLDGSSRTKTQISTIDIISLFVIIYLLTMITQSIAIYSILT